MTAINLCADGLYYKVRHPEFEPDWAYRAIAYIDYGESAWSKLLFVTQRGMTYGVKVHRCVCLGDRGWYGMAVPLTDRAALALPWPRPVCKNPELDDD
ncbi:MAG: hypothetical protein ACYDCI_00110 [Candidatus Limnocylindrales bacterium]